MNRWDQESGTSSDTLIIEVRLQSSGTQSTDGAGSVRRILIEWLKAVKG
ncbi:hypothetical protein [Paenibacillus glacialis]|nr:hypothetical protein [Paenibacillus glacialis]